MYDYDRRTKAAARDFLVPVKPTDSNRQIAQRMVLHAAAGKRVLLSPKSSPRHKDYALWYDEGELTWHALIKGRKASDLNGEHLAAKVVEAWVKDYR